MFLFTLFLFALTTWFGLYLLVRYAGSRRSLSAGAGLLIFALGLGLEMLYRLDPANGRFALWHHTYFLLLLFPWVSAVIYLLPEQPLARSRLSLAQYRLLAGSITFLFGLSLWLHHGGEWLARAWLLPLIGLSLVGLGWITAVIDAHEQGEALWPDLFRSFDYAFFTALLFGGLVGLTIYFSTGLTSPMLLLLLLTITAAITLQIFADPVQEAVDNIALAYFPQLRQARSQLRTAANSLPRLDSELDLSQLTEAEFTRLTRRALSQMGNLPRLVANPLVGLPLIRQRLAERGEPDDTLLRAAELKALLTEAIERLKPDETADFGTTDAWRHYNALYFPYVVGLRPYSRRTSHTNLEPASRQALDWFRQAVPERTLYNWQNAAAELVAHDVRQRARDPAAVDGIRLP
jgi:hypothetical protein